MQGTDIIRVNVTGTNGQSRKQSTISRVFDGLGRRLTDKGAVDQNSSEILRSLPNGGVTQEMPEFPQSDFDKARSAKNAKRVQEIQIEYAERVAEWEKVTGGGNESLQIAKAVLAYAKEFHDFSEDNADKFVMKLDNLDVSTQELPDKRAMYIVSGTAVFGS